MNTLLRSLAVLAVIVAIAAPMRAQEPKVADKTDGDKAPEVLSEKVVKSLSAPEAEAATS